MNAHAVREYFATLDALVALDGRVARAALVVNLAKTYNMRIDAARQVTRGWRFTRRPGLSLDDRVRLFERLIDDANTGGGRND